MANQWQKDYIKSFTGENGGDDEREKQAMLFAAKMKEKHKDRPEEIRRQNNVNSMSEAERQALTFKILMEEAELNRGKTREQIDARIRMEKIGWEREDRLVEGRCRWYDCDEKAGVPLFRCPCEGPGVVYCSAACQKLDWKVSHKDECSARKKPKQEA